MDAKKLRVLFLDDEDLAVIDVFKKEGYDVEHWREVESLEKLADGRYQVVFLDVRGVGGKYGGTGLDVLKYVATHNPLIFTIVFSAKPFSGADSEIIRLHARRCLPKDITFYELVEMLDLYAKELTPEGVIKNLQRIVNLGWYTRFKIRHGYTVSANNISHLAKRSGIAKDAVTIISNCVSIAAALIKLAS